VTPRADEGIIALAAARPAHAELKQLAIRDEALLDRVTDRRPVVEVIAPDLGAARVEVRVDVPDREWAVTLRERALTGTQ
jgi:hypothetical protein